MDERWAEDPWTPLPGLWKIVVRVNVRYGAKLLSQELVIMGITLKFDTGVCLQSYVKKLQTPS